MNDFEIYKVAEKKIRLRMALEIHTIIFVAINVLLFVLNLTFTPGFGWFIIVLFSWGLGLLIHFITFIIKKSKHIGILVHFSTFIFIEFMLVYINLSFQPNFFWFVFPMIGFFISLSIHGLIYYMYLREREDQEKITWYVKRIEKEAEKIKKKVRENE